MLEEFALRTVGRCDMRRAADHQKVVLISLEQQVELLIRAIT